MNCLHPEKQLEKLYRFNSKQKHFCPWSVLNGWSSTMELSQPPWTLVTICTTELGLILQSDNDAESSSSGFPSTTRRISPKYFSTHGTQGKQKVTPQALE